MPDLFDSLNAIRGIQKQTDPRIKAQRLFEAKTKLTDYASFNAEVRPLIPGCLTMETLRQLSERGRKRRRDEALAKENAQG